MRQLKDILPVNCESDKRVNNAIVSVFERSTNDEKINLLLDLYDRLAQSNERVTNELKELRTRVYGS